MRRIGIFGGSFDPVHFGHLRPALEILQALSLDEIRFIPAGQPPLRQPPVATASQRLQMLRLAVVDEPRFIVDDREIRRNAPSYTVDTLGELRREYPGDPLTLMLGTDAYLSLPQWRQWRKIYELAHIVVAHRPGWKIPGEAELADMIRERRTELPADLSRQLAGRILFQQVTQINISSTQVRATIAAGGDPRYLLPDSVRELILNTRCYA
ncbi:MAG: nicotinate-nucleotide adenylyltransferase [Gammaproteobacteria bacterium]|nr:nicotinate-nucleotide adenylyltransferase [Gammaproteobacteria bacterium]